jgi:hypothetical protein
MVVNLAVLGAAATVVACGLSQREHGGDHRQTAGSQPSWPCASWTGIDTVAVGRTDDACRQAGAHKTVVHAAEAAPIGNGRPPTCASRAAMVTAYAEPAPTR